MPQRLVTWYLPVSGDRWPEDYERGRPGWPPEVADIPGLSAPGRVLDLGAGTGKLTRRLIPAFDRTIAVEPQSAMRRMLRIHCPDADVLAGTAEHIPLADASIDAIFVAEAFHHLGNERAVAEIARVLRLGGSLVMMWNLPAGPWEPSIAAVNRLLRERLPKTEELAYDPLDLNHRRYATGEWRKAFATSRFKDLEKRRLANPQTLDREGLLAYFASMGWIADLSDEDRLPLLEEVRSLLDATEYRRSWETHLHWTRLADT